MYVMIFDKVLYAILIVAIVPVILIEMWLIIDQLMNVCNLTMGCVKVKV